MENSILDDLSAVVGYTATRKLAAWFGGRRLYVPQRASESHPLATLIGMPAFRALVREFAGDDDVFIPSSLEDERYLRDREIAERLAAGESAREIAARLSLTDRRIEQIRLDLAQRGWLLYAEGYKRAMRRSGPARRRGDEPEAPALFLGTGEVSAESPPAA